MKNILTPWQKILLTLYFCLLIIFGVGGNLIVCITFSSRRIHQTTTNPLIVNLAVADMLQCFNLVFIITALNDITWFKIDAWCKLNGVTNVGFAGASLLSLTLISINRYFIIVRKPDENIFKKRNLVLFILGAWLYAFAYSVSPVLGWSEYIHTPSFLFCFPNHEKNVSYIAFAIVTLTIIPFTILCFCTWKIFMTVYITRQSVEEQISSSSTKRKRERRVTLMLLVVIITFFILNTPFCVVLSIRILKYEVKPWFDYSSFMILMLNHVNNPMIYGLMNGNFKEAFSQLFCQTKRLSRTTPVQNIHQRSNSDF